MRRSGRRAIRGNVKRSSLNHTRFRPFRPVRGAGNGLLPATGQSSRFDRRGRKIACAASGQDDEAKTGRAWPEKRFSVTEDVVIDHLTGLAWRHVASLTATPASWREALAALASPNGGGEGGISRLPRYFLRPAPSTHEIETPLDFAHERSRSLALPKTERGRIPLRHDLAGLISGSRRVHSLACSNRSVRTKLRGPLTPAEPSCGEIFVRGDRLVLQMAGMAETVEAN